MSFKNILEKYRDISFSERDKGDRFERLMQAYLLTDPKYAYQFKNVCFYNSERRHTRIGAITPKEKYLPENKPTKVNYNYI